MTNSIPSTSQVAAHTDFVDAVRHGLAQRPRRISSMWFYDPRGNALFQRIMDRPEYYLTGCEREIFRDQAASFLETAQGEAFDLVELGAGDGTKTQYLIEHFLAAEADFRYLPIDISCNALAMLTDLVKARWPRLGFTAVQGDYFKALSRLPKAPRSGPRRKMVLFPGGNIGNFTPAEAEAFLLKLNIRLEEGDVLITGFDLKKDPAKILAAYNDAGGVTRDFNLNLLERMNRELDADFNPAQWRHWPSYDPVSGATRSCLVSTQDQTVWIGALEQAYEFAAWEAMDLEISQKYSTKEIEALAERTGFNCLGHLLDSSGAFVDSIWRV